MSRKTLAVLCLVGVGAGANVANISAGSWQTYYPVGQKVSLELPSTWQVEPCQDPHCMFSATAPDGVTDVELLTGPYSGAPGGYFATQTAAAHQAYLAIDPRALIQSHRLALPGGAAVEVISHFVQRSGSKTFPLAKDEYDFLRSGKVYLFDYLTTTPEASIYFPVFDRSARTIRFS